VNRRYTRYTSVTHTNPARARKISDTQFLQFHGRLRYLLSRRFQRDGAIGRIYPFWAS
jgi:hypothetical protein